MSSDLDYMIMAYCRQPQKYAHLLPKIEQEIENECRANDQTPRPDGQAPGAFQAADAEAGR